MYLHLHKIRMQMNSLRRLKAASEDYFDMMSENAIYIDTDASERWTKKKFHAFCEPHFITGKTLNFKPFDRQIHLV